MSKLENFLRQSLNRGELSTHEAIAILGACETISERENSDRYLAFVKNYGTFAQDGLKSLFDSA